MKPPIAWHDTPVVEDSTAAGYIAEVEHSRGVPDVREQHDVTANSELPDGADPPTDASDGDLGLVVGCGGHLPTIDATFELCPGASLLGMVKVTPERIVGVTCTEVCCTFGFSGCLHEWGGNLGACWPNPAAPSAACDHTLQP